MIITRHFLDHLPLYKCQGIVLAIFYEEVLMSKACVVSFLSVMLWTVCVQAGFEEGLKADLRGDYASALQQWRPLAEQGLSAAQVNYGNLFSW